MFKILVLVCSIAIPRQDCQWDNALDVISGPEVQNELMCGFHGQAFVAELATNSGKRDDEYLKINCIRTTIGKDNVG